MRICLYQPDIAQNVGTILRMAACLNLHVDIIEPCGFPFDNKKFKRAGMDYLEKVNIKKHISWKDFTQWHNAHNLKSRVILFTTKTSKSFTSIDYCQSDILLFGRESAGVPDYVSKYADIKATIPMQPDMRSLNVAISCAIASTEALRQTNGFK